jgi:outer membrane autotransporter protein
VPQGGTITIGPAQTGSQSFGNEQAGRFAGDRDANAGDPNADRGLALAFGAPDPDVIASLGLTLPAAREFWAWGRIYGTHASVFGNGTASYKGVGLGGAGGVETKPDKDSLIGLAFGIGHSRQKADAGDKGQLDSYRLGIYSQRYAGPVFFGATLNGAYNRGHAESPPDPITGQSIEGSFSGYQFGASVTGGYRFEASNYAIEPWLGIEYERLHQNAFTLSGTAFADLHVDAVSLNTGRTRVGARFIKSLKIGDQKSLRLVLQGGWAHDFLDVTPTVTQRIGTGASFVSTGTKTGRDAAFGGIDARLGLNEKIDLTLGVSGDVRENANSQSISIGLRFKW